MMENMTKMLGITKITSIIVLAVVMSGCGKGNNQATDELITVDVTASYPEKELILQDFMDVEYVALETTDEFLTQGVVEDIGKDIILVKNYRGGDIFVFDRTGKALRKINRSGQGGEEYSQIEHIILDEDNNEMFVKDYQARKILVYDLYGNFKRSFKYADTGYYSFAFNYDRDNLICYKTYLPIDNEQAGYILVSKQDGSITREIHIPVKDIVSPVFRSEEKDMTIMPSFFLTTPYHNSWILTNVSSDTVYNYLPDGNLKPIVVRTPSVHSLDPEVFLFISAFTDRYCFMHTMKKEFNFERMKGFPGTDLVYDKQEKTISKYTIYNDDFSNKQQVNWSEALNQEATTWQCLEAPNLVEAYKEGHLKGRLKEIAAGLDEESNPVIMLLKHKS
jgi:hypothetical protein